MNINHFNRYKRENKKISIVTCYDYWSATIISESDVDAILVGDSLAMVMHGYTSTLPADTPLMAAHTAAVRRGAPETFIIADMPFLSHRKSMDSVLDSAGKLMQAGANAIKIEGASGHIDTIRYLVESGIPVMGHLGLTPQSVQAFGGFKVQGKTDEAVVKLLQDAKELEEAGCFSIVVECIPDSVAQELTEILSIPTIGIGAGKQCDGQVLVLQDMLGVNTGYTPKFVRKFLDGASLIKEALNSYNSEVKEESFPGEGESYGG